MCGKTCGCENPQEKCARTAETSDVVAGEPLPPSPRGAEKCLLAATERYSIFGFDGRKSSTGDYRIRDIERCDLLSQVSRACERFPTVLVERIDNL